MDFPPFSGGPKAVKSTLLTGLYFAIQRMPGTEKANAVDLRTVQQWLGHKDMESTMRYLKPSQSQQMREKVNKIFARRVRVNATFSGA